MRGTMVNPSATGSAGLVRIPMAVMATGLVLVDDQRGTGPAAGTSGTSSRRGPGMAPPREYYPNPLLAKDEEEKPNPRSRWRS